MTAEKAHLKKKDNSYKNGNQFCIILIYFNV